MTQGFIAPNSIGYECIWANDNNKAAAERKAKFLGMDHPNI